MDISQGIMSEDGAGDSLYLKVSRKLTLLACVLQIHHHNESESAAATFRTNTIGHYSSLRSSAGGPRPWDLPDRKRAGLTDPALEKATQSRPAGLLSLEPESAGATAGGHWQEEAGLLRPHASSLITEINESTLLLLLRLGPRRLERSRPDLHLQATLKGG